MLIKKGIQFSVIETDNTELLSALQNLYTFPIKNAVFSNAYKRGHWDGKKRFISHKGIFRTGLLPYILNDLERIGCYPEIELCYNEAPTVPIKQIKNLVYYDYQEQAIEKILAVKRGIIKAPTASGKTLILAGLLESIYTPNAKIILLYTATQLLVQTYEFLKNMTTIPSIGVNFGQNYQDGDIMLTTVQSIEKVLDSHLEDAIGLFVDECHEYSTGETFLAAVNSFPDAQYRIGFTGTVPSEDIPKYNIFGALGEVIEVAGTQELIRKKKLAKPIIQILDRTDFALSGMEDASYRDIYNACVVNNEARNKQIARIVSFIKSTKEDAKILILVKSLRHGNILKDLLGGNCIYLEGKDSIMDRYKEIDRFRKAKDPIPLVATKILQTGIDIKEITHFINARGMKSEIAVLQALGRSLRPQEEDAIVYVYDFKDGEKYLLDHSKKRIRYYKKEGHAIKVIKC